MAFPCACHPVSARLNSHSKESETGAPLNFNEMYEFQRGLARSLADPIASALAMRLDIHMKVVFVHWVGARA
jgi:hypothetical protein